MGGKKQTVLDELSDAITFLVALRNRIANGVEIPGVTINSIYDPDIGDPIDDDDNRPPEADGPPA